VTGGLPPLPPEWRTAWFQLHALLQFAGFACVTVASALGVRTLLDGPRDASLEPRILAWTRAGFLLLGGALAAGALWTRQLWGGLWPRRPQELWGLWVWLLFFVVLHVHRVKAFKGRTAVMAGLAAWALAVPAWFLWR
jgi:ABC-type transport system involved in cytochrome c biogenesis permease subunit